jgi:plasmid stabilization system protein ParE
MVRSWLLLSDRALADLDEIQEYIVQQDGKLRATAIVARLNRSLESSAFTRGIGRNRPNVTGRNIHFHPVAPWPIAYTIVRSKDGIYV